MHRFKILTCICILGVIGSVRAADKYTDENRPYEFGFTIEGEQHRHEKKDENGIIMGEFGFITADGVYHVTVYATDENGNFKILSMKNIRVKPYPTAKSSSAVATSSEGVKKGHSIPFPPSNNSPVVQGPLTSKAAENSKNPQAALKPLTAKPIASPAKSCSHCSIPTTTTKAPPIQLTDIAVVSRDRSVPDKVLLPPNEYQQNTPPQSTGAQNNFNAQGVGKSLSSSYTGQQTNSGYGQSNSQYPQDKPQIDSYGNVIQNNYQQQDISNAPNVDYPPQNNFENPSVPQSNNYYPQNENSANQNVGGHYNNQGNVEYNNAQRQGNDNQNYPQQPNYVPAPAGPGQDSSISSQAPSLRNPKQYNDIPALQVGAGLAQDFRSGLESLPNKPVSDKPTLVAAQMQIVPKDTDIYRRGPGENEGLPSGLSNDDMSGLLYTFNYTVGFHGHHEEGYLNGAKKGYYYVTGRNGIRTRVDYVADENGYRPKISQEVLDILSDDVPKPETEKDEKFGLKGYEFKWLYFPTNERK